MTTFPGETKKSKLSSATHHTNAPVLIYLALIILAVINLTLIYLALIYLALEVKFVDMPLKDTEPGASVVHSLMLQVDRALLNQLTQLFFGIFCR